MSHHSFALFIPFTVWSAVFSCRPMDTPSTPQRVRDPIEDIKQSLSTKWDLRLSVRPSVTSPSQRDRCSIDEKIYNYLHFLYYHKSLPERDALEYAIDKFNREAPVILSNWQFKPRAEPGVIPVRNERSPPFDFLHRHDSHDEEVSKGLVQHLESILGSVAGDVKRNQPYKSSNSGYTPSLGKLNFFVACTSCSPSSYIPWLIQIEDDPATVTSVDTNPKPKQTSDRIIPMRVADQHFSSDTYTDDELNAILYSQTLRDEVDMVENFQQPTSPAQGYQSFLERSGQFVTPATSPMPVNVAQSTSSLSVRGLTKNDISVNDAFALPPTRKRGRTVSPSPMPHKSFRGSMDDSSSMKATIRSFTDLENMGMSICFALWH